MKLNRSALGALSVVALVGSSLAIGAATAGAVPVPISTKVEICHRTNSDTNPYVLIEPDVSGVLNGHDKKHDEPFVYGPDLKPAHQKWGDIIPAFYYMDGSSVVHFLGLNLTTKAGLNHTGELGAEILAHGCTFGENPPDPILTSLQVTKSVVNGPATGDSVNGFDIAVTCDDDETTPRETLHFTSAGGVKSVDDIPDGLRCWAVEQGTGSVNFTATVTYLPVGADDVGNDTAGVVVDAANPANNEVTVTNTFPAIQPDVVVTPPPVVAPAVVAAAVQVAPRTTG